MFVYLHIGCKTFKAKSQGYATELVCSAAASQQIKTQAIKLAIMLTNNSLLHAAGTKQQHYLTDALLIDLFYIYSALCFLSPSASYVLRLSCISHALRLCYLCR